MSDFKRDLRYDLSYSTCIYSGIIDTIDFEIKYGKTDQRDVIGYLVNRYCAEEVVSGKYLREKYNEYIKALKSKGIIQ